MRIIVDAMGGDNAPAEIVLGSIRASEELGVEIMLVGRGEEILKALQEKGIKTLPKGVEVTNAEQVVDMHDNPSTVVKEKKDSSLVVGMKLLANGDGDAFVSAGSTGAILTASTLTVKRIKGIRRAALAPVLPTAKGGALLIDCGANTECTPEYLMQFAYMGSFYAESVMKRPKPKIGLLNIGSEETKGCDLQKETYKLLRKAGDEGRINFYGNVEARDVPLGAVDVVVTDGFSGNILLKGIEGCGIFFSSLIKDIFMKNGMTKLASLIVKDGLSDFKKLMDYRETGGTVLLGIAKPVCKAHGSSDAYAFYSAIRQAKLIVESGITQKIEENIEYMETTPRTEE